MKAALVVFLVLSLVTSVAAQNWEPAPHGPIARSIAAEASRLVAIQSEPKKSDADDSAWAHLQKVERGVEVDVLDRAGTVVRGRFAEADDVSLTLRDGPLINRIARADVVQVATTRKGGSPSGAASGAAIGILAAILITPALAFSPCNGSCADEKVMLGATLVGLPVGLGVAGYHVGRTKSRVIYRVTVAGTAP